jgi:hypothetical protein
MNANKKNGKAEAAPRRRKILALLHPVALYVDDSEESSRAQETLRMARIETEITRGEVEPWRRKPMLLYRGAAYQGLGAIERFLDMLEFWSDEEPLVQRSTFDVERKQDHST